MKPSLVIIGLGNPGKSYEETRHNTGFQALDALSKNIGEGDWKHSPKFLGDVQEARVLTFPVLLVKPHTYMNRSGESMQKLVDFYKLKSSEQVLVLCDDIDLPLGDLRLRKTGGPGTHNGLKSIVEHYGENFVRLRIGIGSQPAGADLATWVLSAQSAEEKKALKAAFEKMAEIVKDFILHAEKEEVEK